MSRSLLGVVAGFLVAGLVIFLAALIGHKMYPLPPGVDPNDPEAMARVVRQLPVAAFLFVLVGWMAGAGAGAWVAERVSGSGARWPGGVVGGLVLAAAVYNLWARPHPVWFGIVAPLAIVVSTVLATSRAAPAVTNRRAS